MMMHYEMKTRAEILQRRIEAQIWQPRAIAVLPERRAVRRRLSDCVAREMGFQLAAAAGAHRESTDEFGDLLFPKRCASHFNRWYKLRRASAIRQKS